MSHKEGDYPGPQQPTEPERARLRLLAAGAVTQAELDTALRCYAEPGFEFLQGLQFAVWGRRAG